MRALLESPIGGTRFGTVVSFDTFKLLFLTIKRAVLMTNDLTKGDIIVRWEPPDLLLLTYKGHISLPILERAIAESNRHVGQAPYHLALIEVSQFVSMVPEGRKLAVDAAAESNIRGSALIGASFHIKVLGNLLMRAANLIYRDKDNPLIFCDNEAEARVWLNERRRVLAMEYGAK